MRDSQSRSSTCLRRSMESMVVSTQAITLIVYVIASSPSLWNVLFGALAWILCGATYVKVHSALHR